MFQQMRNLIPRGASAVEQMESLLPLAWNTAGQSFADRQTNFAVDAAAAFINGSGADMILGTSDHVAAGYWGHPIR